MLLPTAEIEWIDGAPLSKVFGDVYFQTEGGLAESNYVFLEANQLKEKLLDTQHGNDSIVIAETGFGSGLNFIACHALWHSLPEPKKRLEFVSIEGFPLTIEDLKRSAKYFPELSNQYDQLIDQYPEPVQGAHLLHLEQGKVRLRLIFDDLDNALDQYDIRADIWFLDGFAPKTNEAMWSAKLFKYLRAQALPHTSLSTFTSASIIRKNLSAAGFKVNKRSGYGPKREMITATFSLDSDEATATHLFQPWHLAQPKTKSRALTAGTSDRRVIVVGAGIAGLVQSLTLARLGFDVKLIDRASKPLAGASSQPQLIMYAKYPRQVNAEGKLLRHAHNMAQRYYHIEQQSNLERFWHPIGLAQLAWTESEQQRQNDFINNYSLPNNYVERLSANELSLISGINIESSGLFFKESGWLDTKAFASFVLQQNNIEFYGSSQVTSLTRGEDNAWLVVTNNHILVAKQVVLCNAYGANALLPDLELPLKQLRGQTSQLISKKLAALSCVVCGEGYLSPAAEENGELHVGATYDLNNADSSYREEDNVKNVKQLEKWLKGWSAKDQDEVTGGEAGLRTTSADYTPIAGPVPIRTSTLEQLAELANNAKSCQSEYGIYEEGLYLNAAYGSKGLTFAPMCADLIASDIAQTPSGNSHQMQKMLSPTRFLIRKLKKGLIKS